MRRIFTSLSVALLFICLALVLSGCACKHDGLKGYREENVVEPDCENAGKQDSIIYCSDCGEVLTTTILQIPAKGHTPGEWVTEAPATCTEDGSKYRDCIVCGERDYLVINKLGYHSYASGVCTLCGNVSPASTELEFTSNGNGTCYVSGIGSCTDEVVVIPAVSPGGDNVVAIGERAFENCTSIKDISIPESIREICEGAFSGCTALTTLVIPEGTTKIRAQAFSGCTSLKNASIADSVVWMGEDVFDGCRSLRGITFVDPIGWEANVSSGTYISLDGMISDPSAALALIRGDYSGMRWMKRAEMSYTPSFG